ARGAGAWPLDFPRASWLLERAKMVREEPCSRSGTSAAHRACLRGVRDRTVYEAGSHRPCHRCRAAHAAWTDAVAAKLRADDAERDLHRQGREPGLRC